MIGAVPITREVKRLNEPEGKVGLPPNSGARAEEPAVPPALRVFPDTYPVLKDAALTFRDPRPLVSRSAP